MLSLSVVLTKQTWSNGILFGFLSPNLLESNETFFLVHSGKLGFRTPPFLGCFFSQIFKFKDLVTVTFLIVSVYGGKFARWMVGLL